MKSSKKKEKQSTEDDKAETSNILVMSQLAEVVSQNILEKELNNIDSFEYYAHQLRTHLHSNPEIFKSRFAEGYRILLEELEKEPII